MTSTRTPERPSEHPSEFPSVPLPGARHQQVRALLVREATPAPSRRAALRWAVPLGAGAVAAAVAAAVALGGSQLAGTDGRGDPAVVPDQVDCAAGEIRGDLTDVPDAWRLLSSAPEPFAVEQTWVNLRPTTCGDDLPQATQALAELAEDGTVVAAMALWTGDRPPADSDLDVETVTVRGGEGVVGTKEGTGVQVWWTEGGEPRSVSAVGLDRAAVLAAVEALEADGTVLPAAAFPDGLVQLDGWQATQAPLAYEPVWYATYAVPGQTFEADGSGDAFVSDVDVRRGETPWQALLSRGLGTSTTPRVVDVDGHPGMLHDNGTGRLWLVYSLGDGVQVSVAGAPGDGPDAAVEFARTFVPVSADDPRLVEPAPPTDTPAP